jgi:general secretion pathway protein G
MKNQKGFTIIELMVVTLIMGLLMALSVAAITGAKKSARDANRKADLEQIRSALEMYKSDNQEYPTTAQGLDELEDEGYISELPSDPSGYTYYYNRTSESVYQLCGYLETGGDDNCGGNCGAPGGAVCNYEVANP